eukprot:1162115-Pelagomonas_calceolata.AAC.4
MTVEESKAAVDAHHAFSCCRSLALGIASSNQVLLMRRCALQVELLVEEGKAAVDVQDRWSGTPLDNAHEVGAQPVIDYLQPLYKEVKKACGKGSFKTRA